MVNFYVQKNQKFQGSGVVLPFDITVTNNNNPMSASSGYFVAPVAGRYSFSFSGLSSWFQNTATMYQWTKATNTWAAVGSAMGIGVQVNANTNPVPMKYTMSMQAILDLKAGDAIDFTTQSVASPPLATYGNIGGVYDDSNKYTHFVGQLIEEAIRF